MCKGAMSGAVTAPVNEHESDRTTRPEETLNHPISYLLHAMCKNTEKFS